MQRCLIASQWVLRLWDLLSNQVRGMTQRTAPSPSGSSGTFLLVHLFHRREDWKGNRASGNKLFQLCSPNPASLTGRVQPALTHSSPAVRLPKSQQLRWSDSLCFAFIKHFQWKPTKASKASGLHFFLSKIGITYLNYPFPMAGTVWYWGAMCAWLSL